MLTPFVDYQRQPISDLMSFLSPESQRSIQALKVSSGIFGQPLSRQLLFVQNIAQATAILRAGGVSLRATGFSVSARNTYLLCCSPLQNPRSRPSIRTGHLHALCSRRRRGELFSCERRLNTGQLTCLGLAAVNSSNIIFATSLSWALHGH